VRVLPEVIQGAIADRKCSPVIRLPGREPTWGSRYWNFRCRMKRIPRAGVPRMTDLAWSSANTIADTVNRGEASAVGVIDQTLRRITRRNPVLNAFTAATADRAVRVPQRSRLGHSPVCHSPVCHSL
jgi:hypothetical protein